MKCKTKGIVMKESFQCLLCFTSISNSGKDNFETHTQVLKPTFVNGKAHFWDLSRTNFNQNECYNLKTLFSHPELNLNVHEFAPRRNIQ